MVTGFTNPSSGYFSCNSPGLLDVGFELRLTYLFMIDNEGEVPSMCDTLSRVRRVAWYRSSPEEKAAALKQWHVDGTGPLADICTNNAIGCFKTPTGYSSAEFSALPEDTKRHLLSPTVPSYEIILDATVIEYFVDPANAKPYTSVFIFLLNAQAGGSVALQSADPKVPLLFDPNFLGHEYDRRVAVEAMREVLKVIASPAFAKGIAGPSPISGAPASDSEEDILASWRKNLVSTWYMSGTCMMGREGEKDSAVVDTRMRVFGVDSLRVADMSVVPIMPNNHTQATAYLVGVILGISWRGSMGWMREREPSRRPVCSSEKD